MPLDVPLPTSIRPVHTAFALYRPGSLRFSRSRCRVGRGDSAPRIHSPVMQNGSSGFRCDLLASFHRFLEFQGFRNNFYGDVLTWISQTRAGQGGEPGHQRVF
jgi:hypothetical protein